MRQIVTAARMVAALVYRKHVAYEFMPDMIRRAEGLAALPDGYAWRQPPQPGDETAIAALLNQEPGFGNWTADRVRAELLDRLATPDSASLVLLDGVAVGTGFAVDASTRNRRVAHGMYLYVSPAHRGGRGLGLILMRNTLRPCIEAGWRVIAYTDPDRYSALLLYLSQGARPIHDSAISFWYWRRILRRLGPALRRAEAQRRLRSSRDDCTTPMPSPLPPT